MNLRARCLVSLFLSYAASPAWAASVPTLAPGALVPGQRAVVHTVFSGTTVETFDAEIIGVLQGGRAGGDMILARATSERVVRSGIAAGMSGAPVYVEGRLVGALSGGWPFTREPIFAITPIGEMLDVLEHPQAEPGTSAGPGGIARPAAEARYRQLAWPADEPVPGAVTPAGSPAAAPVALPLPLAASGITPGALPFVERALAPHRLQVLPGGRGSTGGADSLVPGAAVAVDLMRGDLLLSAIGTVTWRDGDRVLMFGHPFFQAGAVRLPLSTAEITTIVPSDINSFKLGITGREVGMVDQDRRAAVSGRIGPRASLLPLRVTLRHPGRTAQTFRFEMIEDRTIAPVLLTVAAVNSLLEAGGNAGNQTIEWRLTLHRAGEPPFVVHDITAGESPTAAAAQQAAQPLQYLFGNPFERLRLDSLALDVDVRPGRQAMALERARLLTPYVRPGGTVRVRCSLEAWRGGGFERDLELAVPADLPPGRYEVWVGGGHELSTLAAQRRPAHFQPGSLAEAWRRLAELPPADGLHGVLIARDSEWSVDGRDYPDLPTSARALIGSGGRAGALEGAAWLAEVRLPVQGRLTGQQMLTVTVEEHHP